MKTTLIWGGGGDIGQAIGRHLAGADWQVLAAGRAYQLTPLPKLDWKPSLR